MSLFLFSLRQPVVCLLSIALAFMSWVSVAGSAWLRERTIVLP